MTNVFISYERSAEATVGKVKHALTAAGHVVWTDAELPPHRAYADVIEERLRSAEAVLVLWSAAAARSQWVRAEAETAREAGKLVQASLDDSLPPIPFNQTQCASLAGWRGGQAAPGWKKVLASIEELGSGPARPAPPAVKPAAKRPPARILVTAAAAVALALLSAGAFAWLHGRSGQGAVTAPAKPGEISVAVLPFLDLSPNKDQDYFTDGMTEEITSALAKVPELKVIGRTSAFQFKGKTGDLRAIGHALGARDLIEGSVRKDQDQVRITVELIKVDDGSHLWGESYDRNLKGIFAVQEEVATAIAGAMGAPLGLKPGEQLVSSRTEDMDAYQQYLQARALYRARLTEEAIAKLKLVVARDPGFAPAWSLLSNALQLPGMYQPIKQAFFTGAIGVDEARRRVQERDEEAEKAAREAIRLDPRIALAYVTLGELEASHGRVIAGEDDYRLALTHDPNDPDVLYDYAAFLAAAGRLRDAQRIQTQILSQEPFVPNFKRQAADVLWALGRNDEAIGVLEKLESGGNLGGQAVPAALVLAKTYATAGRRDKAADLLFKTPAANGVSRQELDVAARWLASTAPTASDAAFPLPEEDLLIAYLFGGAPDRVLEFAERKMDIGLHGNLYRILWGPPTAALRKTDRFKAYARRAGFVDYWRARGWADGCRPIGKDDFACS